MKEAVCDADRCVKYRITRHDRSQKEDVLPTTIVVFEGVISV